VLKERQGDYDAALPYFLKAIELNSHNAEAYRAAANIYRHRGSDVLNEYRMWTGAVNAAPSDPFYLEYLSAFLSDRLGDYPKALQLLEQALSQDNGNIALLKRAAFVQQRLGLHERAIQTYRDILALQPQSPEMFDGIGNSLIALERYDEAIATYQAAMKMSPSRSQPHSGLGATYARQGKRHEAIREYETALELGEDSIDVHAYVCNQYSTAPTYRAAEIDSEGWRSSTGLRGVYSWVTLRYRDDPEHPVRVLITAQEHARLWGAQPVSVTVKQGMLGIQTVTAIEQDWGWYGQEILNLTPTASTIWNMKIRFDLAHNRWSDGVEAGHRYLELNPQEWETAVMIGSLLFDASRYSDSLPFFEQGLKRHPSYSHMQQYGTALNWSGQSPRAAEVFKASIPLDPDNWEAYYHLGYVYGDMAHHEDAIGYFEEALKRRPNSLEVRGMIAKHRQDIALRDSRPTKTPVPKRS
jgi:tetratricopeptide (TPR) repeat protein